IRCYRSVLWLQAARLRGYVSRDVADLFRARCSAAGELPQHDHGTWRHCVMWRIALRQVRAFP
ncbi:MAG: hypothetical protein ACKPKO_59360, partial [Candidatus Fonsibacter sp.]